MIIFAKICLYFFVGFLFAVIVSVIHNYKLGTKNDYKEELDTAEAIGITIFFAWPIFIPMFIVMLIGKNLMELFGVINTKLFIYFNRKKV